MTYAAQPYRVAEALELASELDLTFPVAVAMVRRGIHTVEAGRLFLAADESHEPSEFEGIDAVVAEVISAIDGDRKITVYGDFDADGVSATSIMVGVLRELGGNADWFIPDRISEGYGLNPDAIRSLKARGTDLVITVDCGVTAADEVDLTHELGMKIVVTDHHQPGDRLPNCPVLHPEVCNYPFKELCGTAVAAKLASALRRAKGIDEAADEKDLDLVALATVTDVMPLVGENRRLVKEGVRVARRAERVGMRALMAAAKVDPASLTSTDFGFRLGPRINAAGRMYRADAGVELFLADSIERADAIGEELGKANLDRRRVEREVATAAEAARRELEDPHPAALVVAGESWHPGVVGIVASTLARRHGVPAVVIAIDGDLARGSARGVAGLDLYQAIADCSGHLRGFGGHRAAAGLQIDPANIDAFRADLVAAVIRQIGTEPQLPPPEVDLFLGGSDIGLELAEELDKLAPFGKDNPPVSVLVPGSRISDIREIGEGKHARFTLQAGNSRAKVVSFNRTSFGVTETEDVDVLAELSINNWKGSSEPQLQLKDLWSVPDSTPEDLLLEGCAADEWWSRFDRVFGAAGAGPWGTTEVDGPPGGRHAGRGVPVAEVSEILSSGARTLILTADAARRWKMFGGATGLGRFRSGMTPVGLWYGSPAAVLNGPFHRELDPSKDSPGADGATAGVSDQDSSGAPEVLVTDWHTFSEKPLPGPDFEVILAFDPPTEAGMEDMALKSTALYLDLSTEDEREYATFAAAHQYNLKIPLRSFFRALREAGQCGGEELRSVLIEDPETPNSPERAAIMARVLQEVGLIHFEGEGGARLTGIVSSEKADLSISATFVASERRGQEAISFLKQRNK